MTKKKKGVEFFVHAIIFVIALGANVWFIEGSTRAEHAFAAISTGIIFVVLVHAFIKLVMIKDCRRRSR